ncbi:hypothetical protein [Paenibacillus chitinolyticus]
MSTSILLQTLKSFVEQSVRDTGAGERPVKVHVGWLPGAERFPPAKPDEPSELLPEGLFPFVLLRALEGEDGNEEGSVKVRLHFGTSSTDPFGYADVLNLIEKVRQAVLKKEIIGGMFELQRPLKWKLANTQAYPQWTGEMVTAWTLPSPVRENLIYD